MQVSYQPDGPRTQFFLLTQIFSFPHISYCLIMEPLFRVNSVSTELTHLFLDSMGNNTMTKYVHTILLLLTLNIYALTAAPVQYDQQIVEKIEVETINLPEGETFDPSSVLSRMKTQIGRLFSQSDFDNDLKTLVQEYDRVEPTLNSVDGRLYITLIICPKPVIRSISWDGNHKVDTKRLQKELDISACTVFDRQSFNKAFHKLKTYYVKQGFFEASLNYDVILDNVTNNVDIAICINEGRAGRIKEIVFVNFCPEEEAELLEEINTKTYFFLTSWYTGTGTYHEDAMQQDRMTIVRYLQNEGYADARVDVEVREATSDNRIVITIIADKGEPYFFGNLSFSGNTLFTDEEIEAQFGFVAGDRFSPEEIRETVQRISDVYGRRGYIDAVVDYEPRLDFETRTYSIDFTIEEGEQYRVGLIKVFGNTTTQTNVILHETLLVPGEIFNTIKLEITEQRLENIGYFKNVNVYAVRSEGPGGLGHRYRDVHIEVEETTTGNFGAGFGVSTVEGIFGECHITERNFNYKGLTSFWKSDGESLRGGGEYVSLNGMVGSKSRKYSLSWTKPFFRDTPWTVGFELVNSNNRYISDDYDINGSGITINAAYPLNAFLRFGTHYRLSNTYISLSKGRIHHTEAKLNEEGNEAAGEGKKHKSARKFHELKGLNCKLREESRNLGLISAIGINLSYDTTDNPTFPRRGMRSRLEQELAGFGGDHTFMALASLNSYFYPIGPKGVFKFKADARFIVPLFDTKRYHIPIDERLFLGGENAIRGYRYYRLGPQFNTGDPRGGMSMQILSAQYTYIVGKRMTAFMFCDSGHLSFDVWNFGTMWTSVGFGVNLQILESAPPVVLGLGFPINPENRSDVKKFFFSLGGSF